MRLTEQELIEFEATMLSRGYRKIKGHYKSEDYAFWKSFGIRILPDGEKEIDYQVAFLIYDWTKYPKHDRLIGVALEFLSGNKQDSPLPMRLDMSISDDTVTVEQFEQLCENFFNFLKQQKWTAKDTLQEPS